MIMYLYMKKEGNKWIIDSEKLQDKSSVEFHYKNKSIFILKKDLIENPNLKLDIQENTEIEINHEINLLEYEN